MEHVTLVYPEWRLIEEQLDSDESSDEDNSNGDQGTTSVSSWGGNIPNQRLLLTQSIAHYYKQELHKLMLKFPNIQILMHMNQSHPSRNYFDSLPSRIYESINYW